jgi:intraflagellar transport protein 74
MLDKVKTDNARIQELQRLAEEADRETEAKRRQAAEIAQEIEERRSEESRGASGGDSQKYEALFSRDQEMSQFLETFDDAVLKELEEQKKAQRMIVGLLEHTSRHLARQGALPSAEQFSEMRDSLSFKKRALESSASTQEQLQKELEKRRGELEKVNTLDSKIEVELKSLTSRSEVMKAEMLQFVKIDELRQEADQTREELIGMRKDYQKRRDQIKAQVSLVSAKHDKRKSMLADNETARTIEGLEQKLRHHEQNIFHLNEFIIEKELETNFQSEREECGRAVDELNTMHISASVMI